MSILQRTNINIATNKSLTLLVTTNVIHNSESVNLKNKKCLYLSFKMTHMKLILFNVVYVDIFHDYFNKNQKIVSNIFRMQTSKIDESVFMVYSFIDIYVEVSILK